MYMYINMCVEIQVHYSTCLKSLRQAFEVFKMYYTIGVSAPSLHSYRGSTDSLIQYMYIYMYITMYIVSVHRYLNSFVS